ncbi:hypothetical protein SELMODRAFT_62636, partial [Selaginella moellendorffii]
VLGEMCLEGVKPDKVVFLRLVRSCLTLEHGNLVRSLLEECGLSRDLQIATELLRMYGSLQEGRMARNVFESLGQKDLVAWNAMIDAHAQCGQCKEAFAIYERMPLQADKVTYTTLLSCCDDLGDGEEIHACAVSDGIEWDVAMSTALVRCYGRCGNPEKAVAVFENFSGNKDVGMWTAMILCLSQNQKITEAIQVFREMEQQDAVVWSSMIMGYARSGHIQDALEIFSKMDHPDKITIAQVLDAYADLACLSQCKAAHRDFVSPNQELESETMVANALVHMYAKCGSLDEARRVFDRMSLQSRNIVSWTAMISAYAQHGRSSESMELFQRMQQRGVEPNQVTFISILSSCSHSGLIDHAAYCFYSMEQDHSLVASQSHLVHMVDLLGRAGMLKHAQEIGESSSSRKSEELLPCAMVESLLGGCYTQGDREMASKI